MKKAHQILVLTITVLFVSCSSDDSTNSNDNQNNNPDILNVLTNGNAKTWKIESAQLVNTSTNEVLDISSSLNVTDDRFIFSSEIVDHPELSDEDGSVIWKQREAINYEAQSLDQIFKDFYESEKPYGLKLGDEAPLNSFKAFDGLQDFILVNNESIEGTIQVSSEVSLELSLIPVANEVINIPAVFDFTEIATITLDGTGGTTIGSTSSLATNKLYFSQRNESQVSECPELIVATTENIVTFDISSQQFQESLFCQPSNFVTKELEIINGKLVSVSSNSMNSYDISLSENPNIVDFGETITFTRHGTATYDNDIYIIGGDVNTDITGELSDKIFRFNTVTNEFSFLTNLPREKYFADTEILDDKLYVFGGVDTYFTNEVNPQDDIFIYDFNTNSWEELNLPVPVTDTFTARFQYLIFVGGNIYIDNDDDGSADDIEEFLGYYDTELNEFFELDFAISNDLNLGNTFRQITIVNNKLYLLTGPEENDLYRLYEATIF